MDALLRAAAVYLFLLLLFRVTGKRTLAQITTFDFVLLLVISEGTQQALLGDDFSVANAIILITALVSLDRFFDYLSNRSNVVDRWVNGGPLMLIEDGHIHQDRLDRMRIEVSDIMEQARLTQGLERVDQIKHAVLERTGGISVIQRSQ